MLSKRPYCDNKILVPVMTRNVSSAFRALFECPSQERSSVRLGQADSRTTWVQVVIITYIY
jgi:hypothetical protein